MTALDLASFERPDQTVEMDLGRVEIAHLDLGDVRRATLQPGWRWSQHQRPVVGGGEYCQAPHVVYVAAGQLHVVMADGSTFALRAGDVAALPAGHDIWVVGDQPATMIDFSAVARPF